MRKISRTIGTKADTLALMNIALKGEHLFALERLPENAGTVKGLA